MRSLTDIKHELDALTERRTVLWRELATGADSEKSDEVMRLNRAIEELWSEARRARSLARFGDPSAITPGLAPRALERSTPGSRAAPAAISRPHSRPDG
jgi:hypothetical protein